MDNDGIRVTSEEDPDAAWEEEAEQIAKMASLAALAAERDGNFKGRSCSDDGRRSGGGGDDDEVFCDRSRGDGNGGGRGLSTPTTLRLGDCYFRAVQDTRS